MFAMTVVFSEGQSGGNIPESTTIAHKGTLTIGVFVHGEPRSKYALRHKQDHLS